MKNKFDVYLSAPDNLIVPQFNLLLSSNVRTKLKQKSIRLVCDSYRLIHDAITDPENGYTNSTSIVQRSPDQILELLL